MFWILSPDNPNEEIVFAGFDGGIVSQSKFLDRYLNYIHRTGIDDNMLMRRSILKQVVNESLLLESSGDKVEKNPVIASRLEVLKYDVLVSATSQLLIKPAIAVSDEQLKSLYGKEESYYNLRQIFTETREEADWAFAQLNKGLSLNSVAEQLKTPRVLSSNINDLGFIQGRELIASVLNVVSELQSGEHTAPVKIPTGYTVLQVVERRNGLLRTEMDFLKAKPSLVESIRSKMLRYEAGKFVNEYLRETDPQFDAELIDKLHSYLHNYDFSDSKWYDNENMNKTGLSKSDKISFGNHINFTISDLITWSNSVSRSKPAAFESSNDLQAFILGLIARKHIVDVAFDNNLDESDYFKTEYASAKRSLILNELQSAILDTSYISRDEIKRFYTENYAGYKVPARANAIEILVKNREFATIIVDSLRNGFPAREMAYRFSIRESAAETAGVLGLRPIHAFGSFAEDIGKANVGDVLGPYERNEYQIIFKVTDKQAEYAPTFEELLPELTREYLKDNRRSILGNTYNRLAQEMNSNIYWEKLADLKLEDKSIGATL